jgi:hypothetical protein
MRSHTRNEVGNAMYIDNLPTVLYIYCQRTQPNFETLGNRNYVSLCHFPTTYSL